MRGTCKKFTVVNMLQLPQQGGDIVGKLVIRDEIVLKPQDTRDGSQGIFDVVSAGNPDNVTIQVDSPVFYVDINFVIVERTEYPIFPEGALNKSLNNPIRFLNGPGLFP